MKERNFYGEEFEKQLKDKADQFKMYPSDRVWNEVNETLHTNRRRFVAGMTLLIGGILILAGAQLIFPSKNTISKSLTAKIITASPPADISKFTAANLVQQDNPGNSRTTDISLNSTVPFIIHSDKISPPESGTDLISAAMQVTPREKTIASSKSDVPEKTPVEMVVTPLGENEKQIVTNSARDSKLPDLIAEKTSSSLTHIRNDRFSWEIYVTPTLNSHFLYGPNQTISQSIQSAPIMVVHIANVNGFVDNTPVIGYNVGGNILYRLTKNLSLKAGLEFSYDRYYIKAYNSNPSQAAVTLSSYQGYVFPDSLVNSSSGILTNKNPQQYQNRYFQLSVPVGLDMNVLGRSNLQLHIGATLQPSYLLNTDAYVLSGDYSTYTKNPQAFRRWNLQAGGDVYLSFAIGKIRWELGPEVRYQIFSTYKTTYPLQENMVSYGIRLGISKSIW